MNKSGRGACPRSHPTAGQASLPDLFYSEFGAGPSPHLPAAFDAPHRLHLIASHALDFIVHVDRRANVVRNDAEPISNPVAVVGTLDVQMPVLLGEAFYLHYGIFLYKTVPSPIARLVYHAAS